MSDREALRTVASMLGGYWISQTLYVAAELAVADRLAQGPCTAAELAEDVRAHPETLARLLRALSSVGVFTEGPDARFANSPLSELLRSDHPASLRHAARLGGHPAHWGAWGKLLQAVREGGCAFEAWAGEPFFDHLEHDAELRDTFQRVQAATSSERDARLATALQLQDARRVIDVGGGLGSFARALARTYPTAQVCLFERPHVLSGVDTTTVPFTTHGGDFFQAVPDQADAYVLKHVLHDWADEPARAVVTCCARAMHQGAQLLVIEALMPDAQRPGPSAAQAHDLNMLVLTGGRERTLGAYDALMADAGLGREHPPQEVAGLAVLRYRLT